MALCLYSTSLTDKSSRTGEKTVILAAIGGDIWRGNVLKYDFAIVSDSDSIAGLTEPLCRRQLDVAERSEAEGQVALAFVDECRPDYGGF